MGNSTLDGKATGVYAYDEGRVYLHIHIHTYI
jgi:hypothetical protein